MHNTRVAARYAKALIADAIKSGKLERLKEDIDAFIKVCNESRSLMVFLQNPILFPEKKAAILGKIFQGKLDDKLVTAFKVICKKNREPFLYDIAQSVVREYNRLKNIQEVDVTTATEISPKMRLEFIRIATEMTNKKVALKEHIDKTIIGGYILKIGDKRIDNSLKSKLAKLRTMFSQN